MSSTAEVMGRTGGGEMSLVSAGIGGGERGGGGESGGRGESSLVEAALLGTL